MRKLITILAVMLYTAVSAQDVKFNVSIQDSDDYFQSGGVNVGLSVVESLGNIGKNWVAELGVGAFIKDDIAHYDQELFGNAVVGVGYTFRIDDNMTPDVILKANWRGYLVDSGEVKGYFEPGLEILFTNKFSITFSHAYEIHRTGFNVPTGRLGIKFKL